jgi:hypothetical protein
LWDRENIREIAPRGLEMKSRELALLVDVDVWEELDLGVL